MTATMNSLLSRLSRHGFSQRYVKQILPDWWEDEAAESASAIIELKMQLSRVLGIDYSSLVDEQSPIRLMGFSNCKFKTQKNTSLSKIEISCAIATGAARIAAKGCKKPYQGLPSATQIRKEILDQGYPWVSFETLVSYLWDKGVAVIHLVKMPQTPKMHGMAVSIEGRPVIVLAKNAKSAAWQLFVLAHEAGHIACGHIEDGAVFDEKIEQEDSDDPLEIEANQYSIEVLTGNSSTNLHSGGIWVNGSSLAQAAITYGEKNRIDPGHIVLNHANTQHKHYGVPAGTAYGAANKAIKIINDVDALQIMRNHLLENLDPDLVPEDSFDYLLKVTGTE